MATRAQIISRLLLPSLPSHPLRHRPPSVMRNWPIDLLLLLWGLVSLCSVAASADCPTSCANIRNVTFPWGAKDGCGAGPGFVLSGCDTSQALWSLKLPDSEAPLKYAVQGIYYSDSAGMKGFLNLTSEQYAPSLCPELANISIIDTYFPPITSQSFPWAQTLRVSDYMYYLLLGCEGAEIPQCSDIATVCDSPGCVLFDPSPQATGPLELQSAMSKYNCSHFQSFLAQENLFNSNRPFFNPPTSNASLLQLYWYNPVSKTDTGCKNVCSPAMKGVMYGVVPAVGLGMAALLMVFVMRRRKIYTSRSTVRMSSGSTNHKYWTQRALGLSYKYGHASVKEFSYVELLQGTDSFSESRMIGDGGFGAVYLANLKDGRKAAVKRLYHDNFKRMDHFYNEIRILSSLKHPNLVKLYGFCCQDDRDLLLIFEYASNGTVADHLHDLSNKGLPWSVRLRIAYETAQGLSYLHNIVSPPIYHRDVKTTNILLDENFHAKLADFGLSRLVPLEATHVSTAPQGTPGYLDPDYHQCYQLTDKSDVYSFGVVLIELVSAKLAVDLTRNRKEINLSSLALMKITGGAWEDLVDPRLHIHEDANVERMVKGVIELAFSCLQEEKDDRPNMSHVTEVLSNLSDSGHAGDHTTTPTKIDMEETRHLMKSQTPAYSPTSVHSVWPSSNTSAELSILY